ncbi:SANT/Myb-like DNA-binding domain-containing protein [Sporobolomyces koalae]|uniref:SANT/Myb-like DNA-binding domain-containing protein n=1 Tax=Sporobolomyces koalae TaxID=500713 RepID=UPI00316DF15C
MQARPQYRPPGSARARQLERAKSRIAQLETQLAEVLPFRVEPSSFELERLQSDNHQLTLQTFALARKLRDTVPSTRIEPEAASIELQQENRKLLADVHLLQSRLATSESQTSRLFEELRRLRPYYLQGSPLIVHDTEIDLLSGQTPKPGARAVLLGDAEAELLLHAGKTQSHVRRIQRISLEKALEDHSDAIAQVLATGPRARSEVDPDALQDSQSVSSNNTLPEQLASFHLPVPPLVAREQVPAQAGVSSFAGMSHHVVNPGLMDNRIPAQPILEPGSELLPSAAESRVASGSSASSHLDAPVAKRRRIEPSPDSGIWLPASVLPTAIPVSVDHSRAIHEPLLPRGRSVGRHSATHATTQIRGAKVSLPGKPVGRTPSALDLLSEAAGALRSDPDVVASADSDDVMQSRTDEASKALEVGSLSYNPRSRKPKLDANGEKKARSPYIKWNVEEDEQLLKAVIQCGCAWDAVAKLCPTRAYHQVRQRFLRGLRSGETLPPELMYLQVAVRQSVTEYESKRSVSLCLIIPL